MYLESVLLNKEGLVYKKELFTQSVVEQTSLFFLYNL
jgi:hypothetical protein